MRAEKLLALVAFGLALAACRSAPEGPAPAPTPKHLVIVTIDTLRADRLGAYGSTTVKTPNLDRLAREGALAEHAAVHVPLTRPSHVSPRAVRRAWGSFSKFWP